MNGCYSVFDSNHKKLADCGSLRDATTLVAMRGEGYYYQFHPYQGNIVDVTSTKLLSYEKYEGLELESIKIEGQEIPLQQNLPQGEAQIFNAK